MTIWLLTYETFAGEPHPSEIRHGLKQFCDQAELVIARTWLIKTNVDENALGDHLRLIFSDKTRYAFSPTTSLRAFRAIGDTDAIAKMLNPNYPV